MINSITMRGIKAANGKQELTGRDIIIGHNGAGKTTRAQALGIALMGHVPGGGKLPAETMKLAHGDSMTVGIETEAFSFTRSFERNGSKVEQTITLNPPNGEKTAAAKEKRIEAELGKLPVMLDFNEFLSLSDMKRREFIYALAEDSEGMEKANKELAIQTLTERLYLPDTADPGEREILESDIAECSKAYPDNASVQAGLTSMLEYAKEQTTYWKKERDKAVGATQKITEYKNELDETDRNLDINSKRLDEVQSELTQIIAEQATTNNENLRLMSYNSKIAEMKAEIAALEASENTGNTAELRDLIAQYTADLQQVDNSEAIAAAIANMEAMMEQIITLEKAVESCRDEYQTTMSKKTANETLLGKLRKQTGACPIDCRIECDKDFTNLTSELTAEVESFEADLRDIMKKGIEARANLDGARQAIQDAQNEINRLRQVEVTALRDNEAIQAIIRDYEAEIAKIESFDATKTARLTAKREELQGFMPEQGDEWELIKMQPLADRAKKLEDEVVSLKAKIADQTKVRNTLINLKNSMVDSTIASYHATAWKRIADAVGPKGLQGELVKDTLAPLTEAIQAKLEQMDIHKVFYFQTEDEKGKEVFQFGWCDVIDGDESPMPMKHIGERRNFDALSTGEQMLLLIALMTTIIERLNPPLKVLAIDNAENLDTGNIKRVLNGLMTAGANLDNIIFSGVMNIDPAIVPGWRVWDLSGGMTI